MGKRKVICREGHKHRTTYKDITNKRIGFFTVKRCLGLRQLYGRGYTFWECLCDCGKIFEITNNSALYLERQSCGCVKEINRVKLLRELATKRKKHVSARRRSYISQMKKDYGLLEDEYNKLCIESNGRCLFCEEPFENDSIHIHHDHFTKQVIGLAHSECNWIEGKILARTMRYIGVAKWMVNYAKTHSYYLKESA